MTQSNKKHFDTLFSLVAIPAAIIGAFTMNYLKVSNHIWLINLAASFVCSLLSLLFFQDKLRLKNSNPYIILFFALVILPATFIDNGIMAVHRWVSFGSIQINVGLIVSPLILIQISRISNLIYIISTAVFTTIIFLLQPDASLVTAFSIAAAIVLLDKVKNKATIVAFVLFALSSIIFSWYNLDKLESVSFVEGIINMTKSISPILFTVSIFSLLLLVVPFFVSHYSKSRIIISLGVYYLLLLASSFFGNFPVMITGYGISPIIGFHIGLIWLIDKNKSKAII
jgi:hypothetical protein